jgi:hypothetical protein
LQYFINLIRNALNGTWNEDDTLKNCMDNKYLSDKIRSNFDEQTINSIAKMLTDAYALKDSQDVNALVECSHKLLMNRDQTFVKLMKEVNTTL